MTANERKTVKRAAVFLKALGFPFTAAELERMLRP